MQAQLVFLFLSIAVISAERVVLPGAYINVNGGTEFLLTRVSIIGNKLLYTPFIETDPPAIPGQNELVVPTRNVYVYDLTTKQQQSIALPHRSNVIFPVAFNDQLYIIDIIGSRLDVLDVDTLTWTATYTWNTSLPQSTVGSNIYTLPVVATPFGPVYVTDYQLYLWQNNQWLTSRAGVSGGRPHFATAFNTTLFVGMVDPNYLYVYVFDLTNFTGAVPLSFVNPGQDYKYSAAAVSDQLLVVSRAGHNFLLLDTTRPSGNGAFSELSDDYPETLSTRSVSAYNGYVITQLLEYANNVYTYSLRILNLFEGTWSRKIPVQGISFDTYMHNGTIVLAYLRNGNDNCTFDFAQLCDLSKCPLDDAEVIPGGGTDIATSIATNIATTAPEASGAMMAFPWSFELICSVFILLFV